MRGDPVLALKSPPSVSRRSISRFSRREASLLVLSKERIQFRYRSHFFLRVEPRFELFESWNVGVGPKPSASKADGVGRQKLNYLDGSQ